MYAAPTSAQSVALYLAGVLQSRGGLCVRLQAESTDRYVALELAKPALLRC